VFPSGSWGVGFKALMFVKTGLINNIQNINQEDFHLWLLRNT
jgi:hypothetical protein